MMSLIPGAGKCVRFIMGQRVSAVDARRRYPYIPADFPGCWLGSGVAWRGGREAEGAGLLNQYTGNCIVGSNPIPSAIILSATVSQRGGYRQNSQLLRSFQVEAVDLGSGLIFRNLSLSANSLSSC